MPPPVVGARVLVKLGVGENAIWKEGEYMSMSLVSEAVWMAYNMLQRSETLTVDDYGYRLRV